MGESNFKKPDRFWSKVAVSDPGKCWRWRAAKNSSGYGSFWIHSRTWQAHRVAWILTYGAVPQGLCVLHKCDNPDCVNPYHLFLGTPKDNQLDSARKGRQAAKLSKEDVLEIRRRYLEGNVTQQELADEHGVHFATVSLIIRRENWTWLE